MIYNNLGGVRLGIDDNGNYGYKKVGADSVIPFKKNIAILTLGSGSGSTETETINISTKLASIGLKTTDITLSMIQLHISGINYYIVPASSQSYNKTINPKIISYNQANGIVAVSGVRTVLPSNQYGYAGYSNCFYNIILTYIK